MRIRQAAIKAFAVLLVLRGLSNFLKPLPNHVGFIFFGIELKGLANAILSPLFGIYMLITAYALLTRHRLALPLTIGYASYVSISMPLYNLLNATPRDNPAFVLFTAMMIGVPWGVVWLLTRNRSMPLETVPSS